MECFDKTVKKVGFGRDLIFILLLLVVGPVTAQRGFGTKTPSKATIVEMKSDSRGLLIPRVELTDLSNLAPIAGESPSDAGKVNSLLVFNTATTVNEEITPGFYYWSTVDQKWHRLLMDEDNPLEPWQVQGSTDKATQNTEDIYQMGSVAIGKDTVLNDGINKAMLDVAGAIRGGSPYDTIIGINSIAVGDGVIAMGKNAVSMGENTRATENFAVAFGKTTLASDFYAFAAGRKTEATGVGSVALGRETVANGNYSMAMGYYAKANSRAETVFGAYNVHFSSVSSTTWELSDPLFQIGNGTGASDKSNALTILKNGKIAIGMYDSIYAIPTERLDVMQDTVRIRDLPTTIGTPADLAVLVDATGRLKSLDAVAFIREPWLIQTTIDPATSNQDDIYQMGDVAIGKDEAIPGAMLDVAGSISGGTPFGNATIGINSIAVGEKVKATGKNSAAFGYSSEASAEGAFAGGGYNTGSGGGPGGNATGRSSFAFGHSATASGDYSVAMGKQTTASGDYSVALGKETEASSFQAFAMGSAAIASGNSSVAMGKATEADGKYSVALGRDTRVTGNYSLAMGDNTIANYDYQTVFGRYNDTLPNADPEPIFMLGNGTSNTSRNNAITILEDGWVGIGYAQPSPSVTYNTIMGSNITGVPGEKLRVNGAILASNYFYPDYVFENYFDQSSQLNPNYRFMELDEIEIFIKKYRHLPGILPASALNRTENGGYEFNVSRLSVKSLEKIEELYLHLFEQEAKIDRLQKQIDALQRESELRNNRLNQLAELVKTLTQENNE